MNFLLCPYEPTPMGYIEQLLCLQPSIFEGLLALSCIEIAYQHFLFRLLFPLASPHVEAIPIFLLRLVSSVHNPGNLVVYTKFKLIFTWSTLLIRNIYADIFNWLLECFHHKFKTLSALFWIASIATTWLDVFFLIK